MLHALGHNSLDVITLVPTAGIARSSAEAQQAEQCIVSAGSSMINALGAEVDRLEADVAKLCPGIRHIDLVSILSTGVSPPAVFMPHYQSLLPPRQLLRDPCPGTTVGTSSIWYRAVGTDLQSATVTFVASFKYISRRAALLTGCIETCSHSQPPGCICMIIRRRVLGRQQLTSTSPARQRADETSICMTGFPCSGARGIHCMAAEFCSRVLAQASDA